MRTAAVIMIVAAVIGGVAATAVGWPFMVGYLVVAIVSVPIGYLLRSRR
jgi:Kef-type K+ transport system membrane component KefB